MKIVEMLKTGAFNDMNQEDQPDGSVIISLTKRGDNHIYKMKIKDLYGKNEEVLWEETIP